MAKLGIRAYRFSISWSRIFPFGAGAVNEAGLQFYDAMLADVSTEANRGRISGIGVGVGYLGSYIAVGLGLTLGTEDKTRLFRPET